MSAAIRDASKGVFADGVRLQEAGRMRKSPDQAGHRHLLQSI
jgi:hypothetical protein